MKALGKGSESDPSLATEAKFLDIYIESNKSTSQIKGALWIWQVKGPRSSENVKGSRRNNARELCCEQVLESIEYQDVILQKLS